MAEELERLSQLFEQMSVIAKQLAHKLALQEESKNNTERYATLMQDPNDADPIAWSTSTHSLEESARIVGVDIKTVKRRAQKLGIAPQTSSLDKRVLILTGEQIDEIKAATPTHLRRKR